MKNEISEMEPWATFLFHQRSIFYVPPPQFQSLLAELCVHYYVTIVLLRHEFDDSGKRGSLLTLRCSCWRFIVNLNVYASLILLRHPFQTTNNDRNLDSSYYMLLYIKYLFLDAFINALLFWCLNIFLINVTFHLSLSRL